MKIICFVLKVNLSINFQQFADILASLYRLSSHESMQMFFCLGKELAKVENLKEMGDVSSGMASTIIQIFLKVSFH